MEIQHRPLSELTPDPANLRMHGPANLAAIAASLKRFGQQRPIVIDTDGVIRAGNGTYAAAASLEWSTIACVETDLEGLDATLYAIADNRTAELAEWDTNALRAALSQLDAHDAADAGFRPEDVAGLSQALDGPGDIDAYADGDSPYTMKIEPPAYEPMQDEPPELKQLFDNAKAQELRERIDKAKGIPKDVREFLRLGATRHVRFDYGQIAEYYCHAPPAVQRLMEDSALVVIDFKDAISGGYVRLCERLRRLAGDAVGDAQP